MEGMEEVRLVSLVLALPWKIEKIFCFILFCFINKARSLLSPSSSITTKTGYFPVGLIRVGVGLYSTQPTV